MSGFVARPMPGFRPGGRPTSLGAQRSRQESRPDSAAPSKYEGVPCASRSLRPRRTRSASLYSNNRRESVLEACCARASMPCDARRLQRGEAEQPAANSRRQPAGAGCLVFGIGSSGAPLLNRREAQKPRARAQHASRTDFATTVRAERSGASSARPWASSIAGDPAGAVLQGRAFCLFFGGAKSESAAGTKSRLGLAAKHHRPEQPQ